MIEEWELAQESLDKGYKENESNLQSLEECERSQRENKKINLWLTILTVCCSIPFAIVATGSGKGSVGGPDEVGGPGWDPRSGGLNCCCPLVCCEIVKTSLNHNFFSLKIRTTKWTAQFWIKF